ncbi:AAA family ATPase [Dictyobacter arantiisoli]|uniref:Clp R domain-containing protein n=1 Tax=Dictyobacter arantiisoli TaxID=2014874 RepID=A0A5A5TBM7_9CHLR|nr:AAA family ATPase [Dictyobacter arantiisoli]GCF08423.1 hypothetical protein KDI_19870 [Dictyobacter arantiisoli]
MGTILLEQRIAFSPLARRLIERAQQNAAYMQATEYHPEHLLLSAVQLDDVSMSNVFGLLGMDIRDLRKAATGIVRRIEANPVETEKEAAIPPARSTQECLDWACTFAEQRHSPYVRAEYILLSALRHPQVQPLLLLMFSPQDVIPSYLTDESGTSYTGAIDQLIQIKIREFKRLGKNISEPTLLRCERPTVTFADIAGANAARHALRPVISHLRRSQLHPDKQLNTLDETLLLGHPSTERTLLVQALAGEAIVSLVTLSCSPFVSLLNALDADRVPEEDLIWLEQEYPTFQRTDVVQTARNLLHTSFELATTWAPCLLFIDNLDEISHLERKDVQVALNHQLLIELDAVNWQPPIAVLVTAYKLDGLDPKLLLPGHFERRVSLSESYAIHPAAQTKLCLSCRREGLANWHYCIYCGAELVKTCPQCGTPHVEVEGSHYCHACGSASWI